MLEASLVRGLLKQRVGPAPAGHPSEVSAGTASRTYYVGKTYLQYFFADGDVEQQTGIALNPGQTHVFFCGNPAMIGLLRKEPDEQFVFPEPPGMIDILTARGFRMDQLRTPGPTHIEKYWRETEAYPRHWGLVDGETEGHYQSPPGKPRNVRTLASARIASSRIMTN